MNGLGDLMLFFSTPDNEVSSGEIVELWKSLSDEEKVYYQNAELNVWPIFDKGRTPKS